MKIIWEDKAYKELKKLDEGIARRIVHSIDEFASDTHSKHIKKLAGHQDFRLRVGHYRVIFDINQDSIDILKVGHRSHVYEDRDSF